MKEFLIARVIPVVFAIAGVVLLYGWLTGDVGSELEQRLPGSDNAPKIVAGQEPVELIREFAEFDGVASELAGAWPRFRGADFDGVNKEKVKLARNWPKDGPKVLWSVEMGEGHAGAAVLAGRVYVLDYDREKKADAIRCLSLDDGREIWRQSYSVKVKRNHGMSRTVPAVTERFVVTLGPKCHVTCLDSVTGEFKWGLNLVYDFGVTVPPWYAGQCPLIDDGKAIIGVGGPDVLMIAVDCETGEIAWQTPNLNGWKMTHSSIIPVEFNGKRMYVYCASGGVVGVSPEDGSILWASKEWKIRIANVPSPVVVGDGLLFFSGGYNSGSMILKLAEKEGKIEAEKVFQLAPKVFGSPQHTPIFHEDYIYGVRPDEQLVCLDLQGEVVWASSSAHKFGLGPYMIADGLIYVMNSSGLLTLAKATPTGYSQLGQAQVLDGHDSWGPMAMVSGRLILRNLTRMICLDVVGE